VLLLWQQWNRLCYNIRKQFWVKYSYWNSCRFAGIFGMFMWFRVIRNNFWAPSSLPPCMLAKQSTCLYKTLRLSVPGIYRNPVCTWFFRFHEKFVWAHMIFYFETCGSRKLELGNTVHFVSGCTSQSGYPSNVKRYGSCKIQVIIWMLKLVHLVVCRSQMQLCWCFLWCLLGVISVVQPQTHDDVCRFIRSPNDYLDFNYQFQFLAFNF
jgi:hypothetical protein